MEYGFLILLFLILTHYFFYPLFLYFRFRKTEIEAHNSTHFELPTLSIIVSALNEEKVIEEKFNNLLSVDYPKEKTQLILVADGSVDNTTSKVKKKFPEVEVLHDPIRRGKAHAMNRAVEIAKNDIIVFTDANAYLKPDALKILVPHFFDQKIGGVSGNKIVLKSLERESGIGDHTYRSLESKLKTWQSVKGSISTAGGELFAVRRALFQPMVPETINDDMEITYGLVSRGYRVIFEPRAITYEEASHSLTEDLNVKARIVLGGYQFLKRYYSEVLIPRNRFAFQLLIHKLLRWTMPLLLVLLFLETLYLRDSSLYSGFLYLQLAFITLALTGWILKNLRLPLGPLYLPFYYVYVNYGALQGLYYFIVGRKGVQIWKRALR